jgi:hypothetical protein
VAGFSAHPLMRFGSQARTMLKPFAFTTNIPLFLSTKYESKQTSTTDQNQTATARGQAYKVGPLQGGGGHQTSGGPHGSGGRTLGTRGLGMATTSPDLPALATTLPRTSPRKWGTGQVPLPSPGDPHVACAVRRRDDVPRAP